MAPQASASPSRAALFAVWRSFAVSTATVCLVDPAARWRHQPGDRGPGGVQPLGGDAGLWLTSGSFGQPVVRRDGLQRSRLVRRALPLGPRLLVEEGLDPLGARGPAIVVPGNQYGKVDPVDRLRRSEGHCARGDLRAEVVARRTDRVGCLVDRQLGRNRETLTAIPARIASITCRTAVNPGRGRSSCAVRSDRERAVGRGLSLVCRLSSSLIWVRLGPARCYWGRLVPAPPRRFVPEFLRIGSWGVDRCLLGCFPR
jgi:hypothetical protein